MTSLFDRDFDCCRPVTDGQRDYLFDLRRDYEAARNEWAQITGIEIKPVVWGPMPADFDAMSSALTEGKTAVAKMRAQRNMARQTQAASRPAEAKASDDGLWVTVDGGIFKIQKAREHDGRYVKAWDATTERFAYYGGMAHVRVLVSTARRMTADEASAFGELYGICVSCGRELTDERSIAAGYGPVCAARHGWPWG